MNIDHGRQGKIEGREAFLIENRIAFDGGLRTSPIWPGLLFYRSETQIGGGRHLVQDAEYVAST